MKIFKFFILFLILLQLICCQLIRPSHIYKSIIQNVQKYYNNGCILLVYASPHSGMIQDPYQGTMLKNFQEYFSKLHIRTHIMNITTFASKLNEDLSIMRQPLFVFLNDFDDIKTFLVNIVTPWIDMAYPNWLIFFRDQTKIENFFNGIYIPFDCKFMISTKYQYSKNRETITEVYRVAKNLELRHAPFAVWEINGGMKLPKLTFYQRRNNLHGHVLKVISIEDPPSSVIIRDKRGHIIQLSGFFGRIIELLQENMNCKIIYQESNKWGDLSSDGTWTGAIGSLLNGTSDILAAELLMTQQRMDVIKFTTPLYGTQYRTFIKTPENSLLWDKFVIPFTTGIWISLGIIITITTGSILIIKYITPIISKGIEDSDRSFGYHVFFDVIGSLCGQGMDLSMLTTIRIVHFAIHLAGVVIMAAYSAALISSLAIIVFEIPFTTLEGLLKDGTYRFGMIQADYSFFENSSDEIITRLISRMLETETNLPINYFDGLSKVCKEKKYALMSLDTAFSQLQQSLTCKLLQLNTVTEISIGLAVRPDSPFREIINNNILKIRDSGILRKLLDSVWRLPGDEEESLWTVVEITDILSLIAVVVGFSIISIILMGGERVVKAIKVQQRRRRRRALKRSSRKLKKIQFALLNNFYK